MSGIVAERARGIARVVSGKQAPERASDAAGRGNRLLGPGRALLALKGVDRGREELVAAVDEHQKHATPRSALLGHR